MNRSSHIIELFCNPYSFQLIQRIKRHVLENGLRVKEFFEVRLEL